MTIRAMSGFWYFPEGLTGTAIPTTGGVIIDSASEYAAYCFPAPKSGTISKVGFRASTVTVAGTMDVRIETTNFFGPSGTLYSPGASASVPVTSIGWYTATLDTGVVVTVGSHLAIKVLMTNSVGAIGNLQLTQNLAGVQPRLGYPKTVTFNGVTSGSNEAPVVCALEYSDGSYPPFANCVPVAATSRNTFSTNTGNFDEWGAAFSLPFPAQCVGFTFFGMIGSGLDGQLKLYDSDTTTVLATVEVSTAQSHRVNAEAQSLFAPLNSPVNLAVAGTYRITFVPLQSSTGQTYTLYTSSLVMMPQLLNGANCMETYRVDTGAWTDTPNGWAAGIGVVLSGFDDGTQTLQAAGVWGF